MLSVLIEMWVACCREMASSAILTASLQSIAKELGFDGITYNSMNSVGDRDFILEALQVRKLYANLQVLLDSDD